MSKRLTSVEQERYRNTGWVALAGALPDELLTPVREIASGLAVRMPCQDMLSGIHNPFGHHACVAQAWSFLDIAESAALLDSVEDVLGPDIVLWDSELYLDLSALSPNEAPTWPVEPLAGTIAVISVEKGDLVLIDIIRLMGSHAVLQSLGGTHYVVRYMPATSQFNRDPRFVPNRRATEVRPLVNYPKRPIWLARGEDRRDNDFATGFSLPAARWIDVGSSGSGILDGDEPGHPKGNLICLL
jgi:hypothetical protein